jgi:hypothetical protein
MQRPVPGSHQTLTIDCDANGADRVTKGKLVTIDGEAISRFVDFSVDPFRDFPSAIHSLVAGCRTFRTGREYHLKLCKSCLCNCTACTFVTFESNSKWHRIDDFPFGGSGLRTIQVPDQLKLCTLTSVTFESDSQLQRIDNLAFQASGVMTIQVHV